MGQGPEGQGGGGRIPELISTNEKPKKTGPLSPAGKQDCPSLFQSSFRASPFREVLLAPHSKRSSASDLVCEANTKHKEG